VTSEARSVLLASLLLVTASMDAVAQELPHSLESGTIRQRLDTLIEVGASRTPTVLAAVRREADRMMRDFYRGSISTDDADTRDLNYAYAGGLVQILGQSRDPAHIPVFIDHAGFGRYATDWLVQFGDVAVSPMVEAVRTHRDDHRQRSGLQLALARMLKADPSATATPLTDDSRRQIGVLASELVAKHLTYGNALSVTVLALATERPDLRQRLERLSVDASLWYARGLRNRALIKDAQAAISIQLRQSSSERNR
jgi:hypothetical protein